MVTQKINANTSVTLHRYADFLSIYDLFNIDIGIIESSLLPERNREQVFHAGEGSGKSGSFFFFSHDKRFIIKTITKDELETLLVILKDYIEHFKKNPQSLIVKIIGVFTIKRVSMGEVHTIVMENTLQIQELDRL